MKLLSLPLSLVCVSAAIEAALAVDAFDLMALRSASAIHFAPFSAAHSSLSLYIPKQDAKCEGEDPGRATFFLQDGGLFLYSNTSPHQQIYVDRSSGGKGKIGYVLEKSPVPSTWELTGWEIDATQNLNFKGDSLLACQQASNEPWSVWVFTKDVPPGNCLGMSARTVPNKKPVSCQYSS